MSALDRRPLYEGPPLRVSPDFTGSLHHEDCRRCRLPGLRGPRNASACAGERRATEERTNLTEQIERALLLNSSVHGH